MSDETEDAAGEEAIEPTLEIKPARDDSPPIPLARPPRAKPARQQAAAPTAVSGEETREAGVEMPAFAFWYAIRDAGTIKPDHQQFASSRLPAEERQELWRMCLQRFYPRLGSLPSEPVLLYWRLQQGRGNFAVVRVTGSQSDGQDRLALQFDALVFSPEEFDRIHANPLALVIGGAFDLVERVGIAGGQSLLPLPANELRAVAMPTEAATPLPNLSNGHHVQYHERSLLALRQWFSWLGKVERTQVSFASWWSGAAMEPVPEEVFVLSFTDTRVTAAPESLMERARLMAAELSRVVASFPPETSLRYPALGLAIGEIGSVAALLQMAQLAGSGETEGLKQQATLALRKGLGFAETYARASGEAPPEYERLLHEMRSLLRMLTEELKTAAAGATAPATPPATTATTATTTTTAATTGSEARNLREAGGGSRPAGQPAINPEVLAAPFALPAERRSGPGLIDRRSSAPPVMSAPESLPETRPSAAPSAAEGKKRRLGENYPRATDAAPRPAPRVNSVIAAVVVLGVAVAGYFLLPAFLGTAESGTGPAPTAPERRQPESHAPAMLRDEAYTLTLNTDGPIWTGVITAGNEAGIEELRKLVPGSRIQTTDDLGGKVFLGIGAKPLVQGNTAKFGIIYRFHPDVKTPLPGAPVTIVSLRGDPVTTAIARRPTTRASQRFANQAAFYLAKGLKAEDIVGFDPEVMTEAQQVLEQAQSN